MISGDEAAVVALAEQFRGKGRRTSRLQVSHAFHSQRMEPMLEAFRKVVSQVTFATPRLPIVSNVTGRAGDRRGAVQRGYWVRQVRKPVRFLDGMRVLEAEGVRASLELGPDGILTALAAGCLSEASALQAVAAQRRGRDGSEALLAALGVLHVHGVGIDWEKVAGSSARGRVVGLRPMRSSGSVTGLRRRRRAGTPRRWGCRKSPIRCWGRRRLWRRARDFC